MGKEHIRVLLVDDHTIVREGLCALLDDCSDIEVVSQAADGDAALRSVAVHHPDVVLMDLSMPRLNGVDATQRIVRDYANTKVIVLSMHAGEEYVRPAIRAGARGYLVKGSGLADLESAIRAVANGKAFFSPEAAAVLLDSHGENAHGPELTTREREVLQLVAEGHSSAKIAELLELSSKTVEGHRHKLMSKLGVSNVVGLVRHAIRLGLIDAS